MNEFEASLGNLETFLRELPELDQQFRRLAEIHTCELKDIRSFVAAKDYLRTEPPETLRAVIGAFAVILIDHYGQRLRIRGFFKKRIAVESKRFNCELLDLFYRCVFEGLDLAPEGDALAS